jgi:hypothetical protein
VSRLLLFSVGFNFCPPFSSPLSPADASVLLLCDVCNEKYNPCRHRLNNLNELRQKLS